MVALRVTRSILFLAVSGKCHEPVKGSKFTLPPNRHTQDGIKVLRPNDHRESSRAWVATNMRPMRVKRTKPTPCSRLLGQSGVSNTQVTFRHTYSTATLGIALTGCEPVQSLSKGHPGPLENFNPRQCWPPARIRGITPRLVDLD